MMRRTARFHSRGRDGHLLPLRTPRQRIASECEPGDHQMTIPLDRKIPSQSLTANPRSPMFDSSVRSAIKCAFDIACAVILIVLTLPVFLIIGGAVRLSSRGPIFFSHERVGVGGRRFGCLKFRTMRLDTSLSAADIERFEQRFKLDNDPRVTPVGRLLRRTSLDELPQLFNVLSGRMSFVGPRPLVPEELEDHYTDGGRALLLSVRPGLTGPWQLSGPPRVEYPERTSVELSYVTDASLRGDLWMILRTVQSVCAMHGSG
jgi:exopolysaccharide production protein ExoY